MLRLLGVGRFQLYAGLTALGGVLALVFLGRVKRGAIREHEARKAIEDKDNAMDIANAAARARGMFPNPNDTRGFRD